MTRALTVTSAIDPRAVLARWRERPDLFAEDVFGARLWSGQRELLQALVHPRVACRSGHKCGKTWAFAVAAWWWTTVEHEARVILVAPTWGQLANQLWSDVKKLYQVALDRGVDFGCLPPYTHPHAGIRWPGAQTSIFGFSAETKQPESRAGYSGRLLYLLDEASGIPDPIHEIASTSTAGHVAMISNPTRGEGAFHRAFHKERGVWKTVHLSSEAAAKENRWIPKVRRWRLDTANEDWIAAMRQKYGTGTYFYSVRVLGEFAKSGNNNAIAQGLIDAAVARWTHEPPDPNARLYLGVDVARFGNDDSVIVPRRGYWIGQPTVIHGQDNVEVAQAVRDVLALHRRPTDERPVVNVDTSNNTGVADILSHDADLDADVNHVVSAASAHDHVDDDSGIRVERMRDRLWVQGRTWLREGGALPPDEQLLQDFAAPLFDVNEHGRMKVESKKDLRRRIGRSPDRADACLLAIHEDVFGFT